MMMKQIAAAAALIGSISAAYAEDAPGFYFGAGVGQITLEVDDSDLNGDDTALRVFGGYKFNKHFAAEIAYLDGGEVEDSDGGIDFSEETTAFQASLFAMAPINDQFSVYAKASLLAWDAEARATNGLTTVTAEDDGNDPAYGVGGALHFGNSSLRLEYEVSDIEDTDLQLISLNFSWSPRKR